MIIVCLDLTGPEASYHTDCRIAPRNAVRSRRYSPDRERAYAPASSKLRVDNVHYDLTESDLDDLFNRIGPVAKLELVYDRAGRSEGVAYVTYESARDASAAVREYDGANANGKANSALVIILVY
ncbi:hypothetical protein V491_07412 [Pseudogymnoascus sp. VKM F-3775]|nr:hypothetical protein V491_07412 [Pseudogymnoascus sp. VKM F-3775]